MKIYLTSKKIIVTLDVLFTEADYSVKTKIIVADFSKGQTVYEHIEQELKDIPVGILGTICNYLSLVFI